MSIMETLRLGMRSSQKVIVQFFLIGSLVLTLTLTQVLTPQDAKVILEKHNEYRRDESASNMYIMHWNVSLQQRADLWAQRCTFKHERNFDLGENLFFDTDHDNDVFVRGLEEWHKEKSKWGYTSHSCSGSCHYTQLIWGYTTTVGCSANVCPSLNVHGKSVKNAMFFVCYYYPRGNFIGNFPYSRGRPCSECALGDSCSENLCVSSGPISKSAPDFVKSLTPQTPLNIPRSSHSFQAFMSLIQQFTSETAHDQHGHHQTSHHRSQHHEHQQHHYKSESHVSSGSESHSYLSQHSSVQQHRQAYHSSQHYHQQHTPEQQQQQHSENHWLKEQDRLHLQQKDEKKRQEIMEQERQQRVEMEKRRQAFIDEQQRQIELEQRQQHLLVQKRLQEEQNLRQDILRQQEEDRQQFLQAADLQKRQWEEEKVRNLERHHGQQRSYQDLYRQSQRQDTDYELSPVITSSSERNEGKQIEPVKISLQQPAEIHHASNSSRDYTIRRPLYPKENDDMTTVGVNVQRNYQDSRIQVPVRHQDSRRDNQSASTGYGDDYLSRVRSQVAYSSHAQETMSAQSSAVRDVVRLLSQGNTEKATRGQIYDRGYETVSRSGWSGEVHQSGLSVQQPETNYGNSESIRILNRELDNRSQRQLIDDIPDENRDKDSNRSIDDERSLDSLDSSPKRRQRVENKTKHLRKKWMYRRGEMKKIEETHPHKEKYIMETDGRRCVDRHIECARWATKCHKSSAVTLSCPMTCGKCGLHLDDAEVQKVQTPKTGGRQQKDPDRQQRTKRRNKPERRELTPDEKKARRLQRQIERDQNAPSALTAHPGSEVSDQREDTRRAKEEREATRRAKEERRFLREQRRQERQRQNQARTDLCRDDPKHVKSCKFWSKKGFCLDNRLIANIYCRLSCNACG